MALMPMTVSSIMSSSLYHRIRIRQQIGWIVTMSGPPLIPRGVKPKKTTGFGCAMLSGKVYDSTRPVL